jgi:hypothetical protein
VRRTKSAPASASASALVAACCVFLAVPSLAAAQTHGSLGVGPALLLTGDRGDATRVTVAAEVLGLGPAGRFGGGLALHALGGPDRLGVAALRLSMQAGAAPPKLWLRLHGELGLAVDDRAPMAGLGLTATLRIWRAAAVVFDGNAHLVIDGVPDTRLAVSGAVLAAIAW